ncbi:MAG: hypothetical protein V7647_3583 [Acidobacteriota bacterium]|jgi:hypothetical protein
MKNVWIGLAMAIVFAGCANKDPLDIPTGSDVTVEKTDGVTVAGRLVEVQPEQVVVESRDGLKTRVPRSQIASMHATPATADRDTRKDAQTAAPNAAVRPAAPAAEDRRTAAPSSASGTSGSAAEARADARADESQRAARAANRKPEYRELTLPAGTTLSVKLTTTVASDTSHVEDPVRGTLRNAVRVDGFEALPVGTAVLGHVTQAQPAGKVQGVASIAFRMNTIDMPGDGARENVSTATYSRVSRTTRRKDATKIGVGAGAGAVIGGLLGGGSGAAKGAAIGGGAGTAVVLSTKGDEVRIPAGTPVTIKLTAPLTVRVKGE